MTTLQTLKTRAKAFAKTHRGKRWLKALRFTFVVTVVGWLVYQLSGIGWGEVWNARPRTAWFYVLWAAIYFQLPFFEGVVYRILWDLPVRKGLIPLFRKRTLNQDVVSYSGEAYFFAWARQRLPLSDTYIAGTLKDNAIASSLGSWAAAGLLVGGLLLSGQLVVADLLNTADPRYLAGGAILVAVLTTLAVRFRQTLFTLSTRTVGSLFAAHLGRFVLLNYVLHIIQWGVVLPDTPLSVWATMLAVMTLINRLPLIPAKGLVGIGAVLGMTELLATSEAVIAAMLLMHSALSKLMNFLLYVFLAVPEYQRPSVADDEAPLGQAPSPSERPDVLA